MGTEWGMKLLAILAVDIVLIKVAFSMGAASHDGLGSLSQADSLCSGARAVSVSCHEVDGSTQPHSFVVSRNEGGLETLTCDECGFSLLEEIQ